MNCKLKSCLSILIFRSPGKASRIRSLDQGVCRHEFNVICCIYNNFFMVSIGSIKHFIILKIWPLIINIYDQNIISVRLIDPYSTEYILLNRNVPRSDKHKSTANILIDLLDKHSTSFRTIPHHYCIITNKKFSLGYTSKGCLESSKIVNDYIIDLLIIIVDWFDLYMNALIRTCWAVPINNLSHIRRDVDRDDVLVGTAAIY